MMKWDGWSGVGWNIHGIHLNGNDDFQQMDGSNGMYINHNVFSISSALSLNRRALSLMHDIDPTNIFTPEQKKTVQLIKASAVV
jgi:hypothetical protein